MKILMIASECVPFCKTGGLADVMGALPKELRKRRHDVRIILPKYKTIRSQEFGIKETGESVRVPIHGRLEVADIRAAKTEKGIKVYFVNHEGYFGRTGLYRTSAGDYADNAERFGFFSRAALEACKAMEFRPDIIHCNDWQTGLVPVFLKTQYAADAFFQHTAAVFTIHNISYQGIFPKATVPLLGLPWSEFRMDGLEYYDQLSFLKAGLAYSDLLTTVSPTYAQEVANTVEYGRGMEGILKRRVKEFAGILNGLDTEEWNPAKDPFLAKPFAVNAMAGRKDCKISLQQSLKLPVLPDTPLLGVVARLDAQKGIDLLAQILPALLSRGVQVVVLGQGDLALQSQLEAIEKKYPDGFRIRSDFNDPLAHHIYGGADIFLMPSRFEPCGLGQLIAMRYGAIPVAASTGGLRDTITPVQGDTGTGFLFQSITATGFMAAIQEALHFFTDKMLWAKLQRRAMSSDFSWDRSAQAYLDLYRRALGRQSRQARSLRLS
jgi:starch synthase